MTIANLTLDDIRRGKNWKAVTPEQLLYIGEGVLLEELQIEECIQFHPHDTIVYSCIFVTQQGDVKPLVMIKEVGDCEYGGDYCEMVSGRWRQVGLVPDPNGPHGIEYVANPLEDDPSFSTLDNKLDDYRKDNRDSFKKWIEKLK